MNAPLVPPPASLALAVHPAAFLSQCAPVWDRIFARLGLSPDQGVAIIRVANRHGSGILPELLATAGNAETKIFRSIADELGVKFLTEIDPWALCVRNGDFAAQLSARNDQPLLYGREQGPPLRLLGAGNFDPAKIEAAIARDPALRERLVIVPRSILREALQLRAQSQLGAQARDDLQSRHPDCSARTVITRWQLVILSAFLLTLPVGFALNPSGMLLAVHAAASLFFLSCVTLRAIAAWKAEPPRVEPVPNHTSGDFPIYSVLVALYREADVIPELMRALDALVWPRSRLEIKLVCEADDRETIVAIRNHPLPSWVELVEVPAIGPRTKPKALAYALPLTSGEFVAIYDAEDKPHPMQLMEAWHRFGVSSPRLACLQAPLVISNDRETLVSRLFAFEYSALFRGLLPWLAGRQLLLPLGGTSNHFRRSALDHAGSWDPCNVTEDADLGLRLMRFGYHAQTLTYPTFEEAPTALRVWLPQRTRWFKGWIQTWLVHMRNPGRLRREIGWPSFLVAQVIFAGMVVSALVHPLLVWTLLVFAWKALAGIGVDGRGSLLLAIDAVNIICGYGAFLALGFATSMKRERAGFWKLVLATPFYWLLLSLAAWRAVWQIYRAPFLWEKTPHRRMAPLTAFSS